MRSRPDLDSGAPDDPDAESVDRDDVYADIHERLARRQRLMDLVILVTAIVVVAAFFVIGILWNYY